MFTIPLRLLTILCLVFVSCSESIDENDVRARIVFAGSEAADGCGWLLKISEELAYKPERLAKEFKVDGLEVSASLKVLDSSYSCGFPSSNSPKFQKVRLASLKRI